MLLDRERKPVSADYLATVVNRFSNGKIGDTIPRNVVDGSDRQPKFILPTLRDALARGRPIAGLALELALWCRYCTGVMENGEEIEVKDSIAAVLKECAEEAVTRPQAFIEIQDVFGDLASNERFSEVFAFQYQSLTDKDMRQSLKAHIDQG